MKLISVLSIARLLLIIALPTMVFASDTNNKEKQKQSALNKIKNGKIENIQVEKYKKQITFSDNILKNQTVPQEELSVYDKKIKGYSSLVSESVSYGKDIEILVTGYSSTPDQCWGDPFTTASGSRVHKGTMACPKQYPFGTKIKIDGMGIFVCEDRGGAIKGNHFDMWFESREEAFQWGKRTTTAKISR
jgi:3D (Asp-Asp-Asp) domain-containing protein